MRFTRHAFADAADRLAWRGFIALTGSATAWTARARAQAMPVIGYLGSESPGALRQPPRRLPRRPGRRRLRRRAHRRDRVPVGRRPVQSTAGACKGAGRPPDDRHRGAGRRRGRAGGKIGDGENSDRVRDGRRSRCTGPRRQPVPARRQSHRRVEPERGGLAQAAGVHARSAAGREPVCRCHQSGKPDLGVAIEEPPCRSAQPRRRVCRPESQRRTRFQRHVHRRPGKRARADLYSAPIPISPTAASSLPSLPPATRCRR